MYSLQEENLQAMVQSALQRVHSRLEQAQPAFRLFYMFISLVFLTFVLPIPPIAYFLPAHSGLPAALSVASEETSLN